MDLISRASQVFHDNLGATQVALETMVEPLSRASETLTHCLVAGGKVITCGNAASSLTAQYMASLMLGRVQLPRPALPAVCLSSSASINSSIAIDAGHNQVFANQLSALGQAGDILFVFSEHGDDLSLLAAVRVAHERSMSVIAMTTMDADELINNLSASDIVIGVPGDERLRVHELQVLGVHCVCDLLDSQLMGPA